MIYMTPYNGKLNSAPDTVCVVRTDEAAGDLEYEVFEEFKKAEERDALALYNSLIDGADGDGFWLYGLAIIQDGQQLVGHPVRPVTMAEDDERLRGTREREAAEEAGQLVMGGLTA